VTGAFSNDDSIWDNIDIRPESLSRNKKTTLETGDGADEEENESLDDFDAADPEPDWGELIKKWKVTLIDFGFARALTPKDIQQPSLDIRRENERASFHTSKINSTSDDRKSSGSTRMDNSSGSAGRKGRAKRSIFKMSSSMGDSSANKSTSHMLVSRMSALGNRNFAAPEIVDKVQRAEGQRNTTSTDATEGTITLTETVSDYVAEYGLLVDAYSMGFTLKYMMTGVLPSRSVEEAIAEKDSLCNKICGGSSRNAKRQPNYRRLCELPREVPRLIQKMTEQSEKARTSVRKVRRSYPWISDVFLGSILYEASEEQRRGLSEISYLPLTTRTAKIDE
jgi:serine/threonine protein kinase